ncbi:MAG: terminase family protein [Verrucomicrobiales bacterium]|nr:terminase family protein [Verrucomicrobiales bacterium]
MVEKPVSPKETLLPYQLDWVDDAARFKIGCWSRQTGKSFSTAFESVRDCLRHKTTWVTLSAGERQALEWMRKARDWAEVFGMVTNHYTEERDHANALMKSAEITWANGSRLLAIPANPDTARGYSANLVLDEFAFHENPDKIWRAIYPSISNPLKGPFAIRIVSTPNGKANKFYDLWTKNDKYSKHFLDIYTAVKRGLPLNVAELKEGLDDPDGWAQEYECQFIDSAAVLLPYELLATCESAEATEQIINHQLSMENLYLGVDIGRKHDLTVLWALQRVGDVLWTRGVTVLEKLPFREQLDIISAATRHAARVCVDATGIGAMLAEELGRAHGGKVEQCQFTAALKTEIFTNLRRKFDDKLIRIPVSRAIREDLHGLQKITGITGSVRYAAPHNDDGHCDRATALALAARAASLTVSCPPESINLRASFGERANSRRVLL